MALRFMFSKLSEGNLGASWTMDTSSTSTLPIATLARRSTRKEERLLLSIAVSFVGMPIGNVYRELGYCGMIQRMRHPAIVDDVGESRFCFFLEKRF
jgi:hypothetical protein